MPIKFNWFITKHDLKSLEIWNDICEKNIERGKWIEKLTIRDLAYKELFIEFFASFVMNKQGFNKNKEGGV